MINLTIRVSRGGIDQSYNPNAVFLSLRSYAPDEKVNPLN